MLIPHPTDECKGHLMLPIQIRSIVFKELGRLKRKSVFWWIYYTLRLYG